MTSNIDDHDFLRRLQMMVELDSSPIESSRKTMTELVDWFYEQEYQQTQIGYFANYRRIDVEPLIKLKTFMIPEWVTVNELPPKYREDSVGIINGHRVVFSGRYMFPVYDTKKLVAGFVGYDAFESVKYLDSFNYGYKAKTTMFYGMENIEQYYRNGKVAIVEGPMCRVRGIGANLPIMSSLGSRLSPYMIQILSRFGSGALVLPDSDEAGDNYAKSIKYSLPKARIMRFTKAKDLDDTVKEYGPQVLEEISQALKSPFGRYTYIK